MENLEAETYYRIDRQNTGGRAEKFEESDIELFVEAVFEDADEADEVIIEETVIESIIETVLEEADEITIEEIVIDSIIDKIAGGEAAHDNTAGEGVAVRDKTAGESEAIRDKIAEGGEAANDNTAGERVEELTVDPSVEVIRDKTAGGVEAVRDIAA